jgi:hypothetical protein
VSGDTDVGRHTQRLKQRKRRDAKETVEREAETRRRHTGDHGAERELKTAKLDQWRQKGEVSPFP